MNVSEWKAPYMQLLGNDLLTDLFVLVICGGVSVGLSILVQDWLREWRKKPADFLVTITDADGIPLKQHAMTSKSAADMISHINGNWYR